MRKLLLQALFPLALIYTTTTIANLTGMKDTSKITHTIDGNINEWKTDKFESTKETQISYSVDHDADNLYMAIKIMDQRTQMKIMMQGMNMYLDKKGKKREGTGIEFPVKQTRPVGNLGTRGSGRTGVSTPDQANPMQAPDPKVLRDNLASNMILLKTFGFDDQEDRMQIIDQPGSVIIAFDWSDADEMLIEYQVPISYLGKHTDLNGKALSIGWKINSISLPGGSNMGSFTARPSTTGSGRGGAGRANSNIPTTTSDFPSAGVERFKELSTWTKYTLTF